MELTFHQSVFAKNCRQQGCQHSLVTKFPSP